MQNDLHIVSIKGGGFMRLELVDITLENGVVQIGGKNRQGKSCILSLIQMMKGKAYMPEIPKNSDSRKGKFEIALGDMDNAIQYIVKYSFTDKNSYLSVEDSEGKSLGMAFIKDFLSPCLDPVEFFQNATATGLGAKERRRRALDVVREVMRFDFNLESFLNSIGLSEDDHARSLFSQSSDPVEYFSKLEEYIKTNRKEWNDQKRSIETRVNSLKLEVPANLRNAEPESVSDVLETYHKSVDVEKHAKEMAAQIELDNKLIEDLKTRLKEARVDLETHEAVLTELIDAMDSMPTPEQTKIKLDSIEKTNEIARKAEQLRELASELEDTENGIEQRNDILESLADSRVKTLESAQMPVKGLSILEDSIVKNGIPLGQDSTEEGITDAFMIGLAKFEAMDAANKPKLKTMVISNASLMDKEARERLYAMAEEHGIQLIMELVMDERESGVIFVENGTAVSTAE